MGKNVDAYMKYEAKIKTLGYPEQLNWIECAVYEREDEVKLHSVNCYSPNVIIPQFVTGINPRSSLIWNVCNPDIEYKIIHTGNQIKDFSSFWRDSKFERLDLTEFEFNGAKTMRDMFNGSFKLRSIEFGNELLSSLLDTSGMFHSCAQLQSVDMGGLRMPNLRWAYKMFYCCGVKSINIQGLNSRKLAGLAYLFYCCDELQHLIIQPHTYGAERDDTVMRLQTMFCRCKMLEEKGVITKDKNIKEAFRMYQEYPVLYDKVF